MSDSSKETQDIDWACINNTCPHWDLDSEDNCSLYEKDAFIYCKYDYKSKLK